MSTIHDNDELPLPKSKMPDAWFKDERMNAMFAQFRSRSVNPQDWDSKVKFWEELIDNYCSHTKKCCFSILELSKVFKRKGRTPLCLPTVVTELLKKKELLTEAEFLSLQSGWTAWAVNTMIKAPVVWSFTKVKNYLVSDVTNLDDKYIHIPTIKELAELVMSLSDGREIILSISQITMKCREKSGSPHISETDIKLALIWLKKSKQNFSNTHLYHDQPDRMLKICNNNITDLTDTELSLFKLKESEKHLLEKIEALEVEKNTYLIKAKASMASGLREVAKTYIKKKKQVETRIEKYSSTLLNLNILIANIHDAHSNTEVLGAYKSGSEMLKDFENAGLSEFTVRDTVDEMAEALGEMKDVQNALSESLRIVDHDELELEEELKELLESESTIDYVPLPAVPSDLSNLESTLQSLDFKDNMPAPPKGDMSPVNSRVLKEQ